MIKRFFSQPLSELAGWLAMVMLHSNTVPTSIALIMGWSTRLPPLNMVLLTWGGLALYMWRAIERKDNLYIVSNGIGWFLNSILLGIIVFN